MSNPEVSLVLVKQENEESGSVPHEKQQQTEVTDDHQRKISPKRTLPPPTTTIKIAPRPANIQPMPAKEILAVPPPPCISMPPNAHTTLFTSPSTFLPGVDDNITSTPLPFSDNNNSNNQVPFLTMAPPTTTVAVTTDTNDYAMIPNEITNLPVGSLGHFDLSQAPSLSVPPTHTQNDNQHSPAIPGPVNLCDNDTMLKDLMAYYTPHESSALPSASRQKQTSLLLTADPTGQESIQLKEKRADNRERKKRWREQNEERNKDNDLRCRVNKRAHSLFGREDNEAKRRWVETEFLKRQCRRRGKQRQMEAVDDVLSSTLALSTKSVKPSSSSHKTAADANLGHLPILQDAYLSMLLNNMGSIPPEASLKLMEGLPLMEATIKNEIDDRGLALPQQLAIFLQQLQKLHASAIASTPERSTTPNEISALSSPTTSTPSTPSSPMVTTPSRSTIKSPSTMPSSDPSVTQESVETGTLTRPSSSSSLSSLSPASSASPQHIQVPQDGLSAMLIQSLQQTAASYQAKEEYTMEPLSPATTECSKQETSQHPVRLYSTEAVMKLMQMNLEWTRQ